MRFAALVVVLVVGAATALPSLEHALRGERPADEAVKSVRLSVSFNKAVVALKTEPTLQVVVNPLLERECPVHDQVFKSLADLRCSNIRFVPWFPYPDLGVGELQPATANGTSWNMTLIDPLMEDFMKAAGNASVIINFSTPPSWLYNATTWSAPSDPDKVDWTYEQGLVLNDQSMKQFADYYQRPVSWYTEGGFVDENGVEHKSGLHYNIDKWEVLNEVEAEHKNTPESYTRQYDAVVSALRKLPHGPKEFVGLALAYHNEWDWYNYFLNASNHADSIVPEWISYHYYGAPSDRYKPEAYEEIFTTADTFAAEVTKIEVIRKTLSPTTRTTIDEIGVILPDDNNPNPNPPDVYWAAAGSMFAYVFNTLAKQQIDVLGESQLTGLPAMGKLEPQFPSVSLLDWNTGFGNPRYWLLSELISHIGDDKHTLVESHSSSKDVDVQGYVRDKDQSKWMIVVNKRFANITVNIQAHAATVEIVDEHAFGPAPPSAVGEYAKFGHISFNLPPFATAFISDIDE